MTFFYSGFRVQGSGFNGFNEFNGGGAVHKNIEVPRRFETGDTRIPLLQFSLPL